MLLLLCMAVYVLWLTVRIRKRARAAKAGRTAEDLATPDVRHELHGNEVQELSAGKTMVELHGSVQQAVELPAVSSSRASIASTDSYSSIIKPTTFQ
jgi:hypothetical protein